MLSRRELEDDYQAQFTPMHMNLLLVGRLILGVNNGGGLLLDEIYH